MSHELYRIPAGATILTPAADADLEVGFGYVAATGQDIVCVTIRDTKGPHVIILTPEVARQVADTLQSRCANLSRLRTNQNGEHTHE